MLHRGVKGAIEIIFLQKGTHNVCISKLDRHHIRRLGDVSRVDLIIVRHSSPATLLHSGMMSPASGIQRQAR